MKLSQFRKEIEDAEREYGGNVEVMVLYRNEHREYDGLDEPICFLSAPKVTHGIEEDPIFLL